MANGSAENDWWWPQSVNGDPNVGACAAVAYVHAQEEPL
jgi:hypothetical protein